MNQIETISHRSPGERPDVRYRRLLFRAWHRGTQETDLILGLFVETRLPDFDATQINRFEALLDCTDPELFDWILGGVAPPPQHDNDVLRSLRDFCNRPIRTAAHNENR